MSARPLPAGQAAEAGWQFQGACGEHNPDLFFPSEDAPIGLVRVCRGYPVRVECLTEALATGEQYGIRAGLSERQRRRLVRGRDARRAARSAAVSPAGSGGAA